MQKICECWKMDTKLQKNMGATIDIKLDEEWTQHKYLQNKIEKLTQKWMKKQMQYLMKTWTQNRMQTWMKKWKKTWV